MLETDAPLLGNGTADEIGQATALGNGGANLQLGVTPPGRQS